MTGPRRTSKRAYHSRRAARMAIVAIFALSAVINLLALYQVAVGRPVSPAVDVGPVLDRIPDIVERAVALVTAIGAIVAVVQGRGDARR